MPSNITKPLYEGGNLTLKEYLHRAIRATGILKAYNYCSPDEPLPGRIEPNTDSYEQLIEEDEKELAAIRSMSWEEAERVAAKQHDDLVAEKMTLDQESAARQQRYQAMIEQVQDWGPPNELVGFKALALQMLVQDLPDVEREHVIASKFTGAQWKQQRIRELLNNIARYKEARQKEIEKVENVNHTLSLLHQL